MSSKSNDMNTRYAFSHALVIAAVLLFAGGCTTTRGFQATEAGDAPGRDARVLLMPPDVELAEVTLAGLEETRADWTQTGAANLRAALADFLTLRGARMVEYDPSAGGIDPLDREHVQIVKLHEVVGSSIFTHKYNPSNIDALPTKKGHFDWTLGAGVRVLRERYDTDYALFLFFRDTQASGERAALQMLGLLGGVEVTGGYEIGFASLADLRDGDIVWFNFLSGTGRDLRKPGDAAATVKKLLKDIPLCGNDAETC